MQHPWLFYALFFVFGYVTCRTFYFLNSTRKSLRLLQLSRVVGLFVVVRALENFHYSRDYRLHIMRQSGASDQNVKAFTLQSDSETRLFKTRAVSQIIDCHGGFFKEGLEFTDWKSAMEYLETHRESVMEFLTEE
tara:strand:- start:40 stop:444 length:405 start_codon:yes stop_codon:yes gene_type:complete